MRWAPALRALLALLALLAFAGRAAALAGRFDTIRPQLDASPLGIPAIVSSSEDGDLAQGEVHALLALPFPLLAERLAVPRDWCQIVLLHLNVKACTHEREAGHDSLTVHSGRKSAENPGTVFPLRFAFRAIDARDGQLEVELNAAKGPMGTGDYRIALVAVAVPQGSLLRFSYAYRSTIASRLAVSGYLATLGRDKVGFTSLGNGPDGRPEYVGGRRGIVERNAVRYYFAVQAHLEVAPGSDEQRFARKLERWFELTERYPAQLHEIGRAEYRQGKLKEFADQARRQQAIDAGNARGAPAR